PVPGEEFVEAVEQLAGQRERFAADAVAPREHELVAEPPLAEELGPARERAVRLRGPADVVVAVPAERVARAAMKLGELGAEPALCVLGLHPELDPLEHENRVRTADPVCEQLRDRD